MAHATMYFPKDFLWGTATAAHQVEGNNTNNDWWPWEQAGRCLEGQTSGPACNWWDLDVARADLDLAADMGTNAHRLSLEWSRIEPEPSVFSEDALDRYRALLEAMHARGIEPMVTLHHFTNPQWLVAKGDFQADVVVEYFERYTRKVATTLGDLIPKWVTLNEPLIYFYLRHLKRVFPQPKGASGWSAGLRELYNMLRCHAAAYHALKDAHPRALVGVAKNIPLFDPLPDTFYNHWWANRLFYFFTDLWMNALVSGRLRRPFGRGPVRGLADSFDFVGINYYTRFFVRLFRFPQNEWPEGSVVSDGNYGECYPEGLMRVVKYARRFQKPIYITENGVPDRADALRPAFLLTHLHQVWKTVMHNYPVMGYYHWSLIDNFEWDRGWTQRFGLIEMDPETQVRRVRESGRLYAEICRSNSISSAMTERYAIELMPALFPGERPA